MRKMINLFALCLVFASLLTSHVYSPNPQTTSFSNQKEDVIVKEGHRVIVVESFDDKDGQHSTKVSISPPKDPILSGENEKFPSGFVDNAKEKIKQAAHVLPNVGQGISSLYQNQPPGELVCDQFGKCTHKIAKVIGKAKDQVSERTQEAIEVAKHKAEEVAEDAYERTKESASHTAQEVKETAKESLDKAKGTAKESLDISKTIGHDAVRNVSVQVDRVKEATEKTRNRVSKLFGSGFSYLGSAEGVNCTMGVIQMLGFATAYGMCVWVTFISSHVLANALTRQQFGVVQSKVYPLYFRAMAYSSGVALLGHLGGKRKVLFTGSAEKLQLFNLLGSMSCVLINAFYLEPLATKVMFEKLKIEKEEGAARESRAAESSGPEELQPERAREIPAATTAAEAEGTGVMGTPEQREPRSRTARLNERLKRLNSYSSMLNMGTLMALTWHLVYLGHCLNRT